VGPFPSIEEAAEAARAVLAIAGGEDEIVRVAVAATILNRWRAEERSRLSLAGAAAAVLREAAPPVQRAGLDAGASHWRALSLVSLALAADLPDPTKGAVRLHHHRRSPRWAQRMEPRALIGRWLFFGSPNSAGA